MARWRIDISSDGPEPDPELSHRIEAAVIEVLTAEDAEDAEISIALLSDPSISAIHRDHLGDDSPTDVITFPLREPGRPLVGDVYIGVQQAERQAAEEGIDPEEELLRLVIHATLHLLGWDHPGEERDASPMYRRQEEFLRSVLGFRGSGAPEGELG